RTDTEYRNTVSLIDQLTADLKNQKTDLSRQGLSEEDLLAAIGPEHAFLSDLKHDAKLYERLQGKGISAVPQDWPIGLQLIAIRIAQHLSQRELAKRLGVDESQVSRDERNDYHGITVERAERILAALRDGAPPAQRDALPVRLGPSWPKASRKPSTPVPAKALPVRGRATDKKTAKP
ncbi:MAG: helix-turn-helix transcriptional regulator, partial [bacterium]